MNSRRFIRSSSQLEETGAEYRVSMVVALSTCANAASQTRRVAQDSFGRKADFGQNTDGSLVLNPLQGLAAGAVSPSTLAWPITPSLGQIATF
jgi:hypothetical protein